MAYGLIYKIPVQSLKYANDVVVEIHKKDYAGTSSDKSLGAGGIILNKDDGGIICGTSLSFAIQADANLEYLDFFELPTRSFMVKLKVNTVVKWTGYIVASEYIEPLIDPPYDVTVHATDGLGLLKGEKYTPVNYQSAVLTRALSLYGILNTIGLGLDIMWAYDVKVAFNNYNLFMGVIYADDYYEGWTLYEVLEKIIPPDATLTQHNNQWLIRRNARDSEKTHLKYVYDGFYGTTTNQSGETALALAPMGSGDVYPVGPPAEMQIEKAWKTLKLKSEHGKRPSWLRNFNFSRGMQHWTEDDAVPYTTYTYLLDGQNYILMEWMDNDIIVSNGIVAQTVPYEFTAEPFKFSVKYCLLGYNEIKDNKYVQGVCNIKVYLSISDNLTTYYYSTLEGWTTNRLAIVEKTQSSPVVIEWKTLAVDIPTPPISGGLRVELTRPSNPYGLSIYYDKMAVCYTDVVFETFVEGIDVADVYEVAIRDNGTEAGEVTIMPTDAPRAQNFSQLFFNAHEWSGDPIDEFVDNTVTYSWVNLMINSLMFLYGASRQIIRGRFRGQNLHLNSIISCAATSSRKYYVKSGSWNLYDDSVECEFTEIPGTATGSSWSLPTSDYGGTGSQNSQPTTGSGVDNPINAPIPAANNTPVTEQIHFERDYLTDLTSRTVTVEFKQPFGSVPIGVDNLHVYRWAQVVTGKWAPKDVKHYFTSSGELTNEGFTFEIDPTESLTGVIVEYLFIERYEST